LDKLEDIEPLDLQHFDSQCPVISNGRDDEFLGNVVVVPGTWSTFVLGEFLSLDSSYLLIFFLNQFLLPFGMDITPMSTEQPV